MSDAHAEAAPVCYRHPKRETYVRCQRCERPICPECQTQAAVGVQCPECLREGRAASGPGPVRRAASAFRPTGTPVVTYVLIGLCVLVYVLQVVTGGALTDAWLMDPQVAGSEPWRLITSGFLHSQAFAFPVHLLFNMYALWVFGPPLESFLGRARYLVLYLLAAAGGSVAEVLNYQLIILTRGGIVEATHGFIHASPSLGASGAVFGLMGAIVVARRAIGLRLGPLLIIVAINLGIGFVVPGIAWQAHLGGFAIGAAVMAVYLATRRREHRTRQVLGVAGVAAGMAAVVALCAATGAPYYF